MKKIGYLLFLVFTSSFGYAQKEKTENKVEMEKIISLHLNDNIQLDNIWIKMTYNYRVTLIGGGHFLQTVLLLKSSTEEKTCTFRISTELTKTIDSFNNYFIEWVEPDWNADKQTFRIKRLLIRLYKFNL